MLLVDPDMAARIRRQAGGAEVQALGVGYPTGSHQQVRPGEQASPLRRAHGEGHGAVGSSLHAGGLGFEHELDPVLAEDGGDGVGHVCVFSGEQGVAALHDGHTASETPEHLAELDGHVPAAQHQEVLGHGVQFHHRGGGQIGHRVKSWQSGQGRACPRVDEDVVGVEEAGRSVSVGGERPNLEEDAVPRRRACRRREV